VGEELGPVSSTMGMEKISKEGKMEEMGRKETTFLRISYYLTEFQ
jgi:hypothetical protein